MSDLGVVVIGRNEGERLIACLSSIAETLTVVYVDSGSTDGSVRAASERGADVVELDLSVPFSAARARNAGLIRLLQINPRLKYVQFVDGDCELRAGWVEAAMALFECEDEVGAVCGRLRERFPDRSIYNWLCDQEWNRPLGEVRACAGNAAMRVRAFRDVGGYREDVIAAEEDELCVRLRSAHWKIRRLPNEMAFHDAAMVNFRQWWRRTRRSGYAFAQGAHLHGAAPERLFVTESRRAWIWGLSLPLLCVCAGFVHPFGWLAFLVFPLQLVRLMGRQSGSIRDRAKLSIFLLLARFPEVLGQVQFLRDKVFRQRPQIIEHK